MFFFICFLLCLLSFVLRVFYPVRLKDLLAWSWLGSRATVVWRKDKLFRHFVIANGASSLLLFLTLYPLFSAQGMERALVLLLILSTLFLIGISFKFPASPEMRRAMDQMPAWPDHEN
jgi:hypothetical protein